MHHPGVVLPGDWLGAPFRGIPQFRAPFPAFLAPHFAYFPQGPALNDRLEVVLRQQGMYLVRILHRMVGHDVSRFGCKLDRTSSRIAGRVCPSPALVPVSSLRFFARGAGLLLAASCKIPGNFHELYGEADFFPSFHGFNKSNCVQPNRLGSGLLDAAAGTLCNGGCRRSPGVASELTAEEYEDHAISWFFHT